jgi:hypothetical protein
MLGKLNSLDFQTVQNYGTFTPAWLFFNRNECKYTDGEGETAQKLTHLKIPLRYTAPLYTFSKLIGHISVRMFSLVPCPFHPFILQFHRTHRISVGRVAQSV